MHGLPTIGGIGRYFENFPMGGIEGGIFFDDEMRKKTRKNRKNWFFGLNLTKLRLNLVKFS